MCEIVTKRTDYPGVLRINRRCTEAEQWDQVEQAIASAKVVDCNAIEGGCTGYKDGKRSISLHDPLQKLSAGARVESEQHFKRNIFLFLSYLACRKRLT